MCTNTAVASLEAVTAYFSSKTVSTDRSSSPVSTINWSNVGLLLGQRLRRWPNNKPTLVQCVVFAGLVDVIIVYVLCTWLYQDLINTDAHSAVQSKKAGSVHSPREQILVITEHPALVLPINQQVLPPVSIRGKSLWVNMVEGANRIMWNNTSWHV